MVRIEDVADSATGNWRHKGQWDPDSVDYEIEDLDMSGLVQLLMEADKECKELQERIDRLQAAKDLGTETEAEKQEHTERMGHMKHSLEMQTLRKAHLQNRLKEKSLRG